MYLVKKSVRFSCLFTAMLLLSNTVCAEERNAYVQLNTGTYFVDMGNNHVDYDPGVVASLALGYQVAERFRLEAEVKFQVSDSRYSWSNGGMWPSSYVETMNQKKLLFLANAYYDFTNQTAFTPYVMGGVGGHHSWFEYQSGRYNSQYQNDIDFAYQLGAGVNYKYDDKLSFDFKYNYASNAYTEFGLGTHQLMLGIRFGF